jgi:antirestriction protein ArdC
MAKNHYGDVTRRILAQLEAGTPPWIKEWKSIGRGNIPKNAVTKRPYSGGNVIFLWAHGYATQRWLTFKQALDVGGVVRKGEHGVKVYFVSKVEKTTDTDEVRHVPFLKEYTVFNVAQCHGLPEECLTGEATALNLDKRNADAQDFITVTGADFREGQGEPYYAAGRDFISMPAFEAFKDADCFYATSFHELGHNADIGIRVTGPAIKVASIVISQTGSASVPTRPKNSWPNSLVPFSARNSESIKRYGTPHTSRIGSSCCGRTTGRSSQRPRKRKKLPITYAVSP